MQNLNDNIFSHHLQNYGAPYTPGSQLDKHMAASHLIRQQTMYNQSNLNNCQVNSFDDPHNSQNKTINHMNSSGNYVESQIGLKHPSVEPNKYMDPSAGFNKQQIFEQMFFSGVNYGKGPPHHGLPGKSSLDISTSKAFDVFSRAATIASQAKNHSLMTSTSSSANKNQLNYNETNNSDLVVDKSMQEILNMTYQNTCMKGGTTKSQQQLNKPLSLTNPAYNQNFDFTTNSQSKSKETSQSQRYEIEQQQKQQQQQQQQQTQQQQQQQQHQQHQQQMGVNLTNPAFNNPASMDPSLRNLLYPTDERLLNLQNSYYDKSMSPQMFSKNLQHQSQMFGPPMTNYTNSREQQNLSTNFQSQLNKQQNLINVPEVSVPQPPVKIERRGRKKKNANLVVPPAAPPVPVQQQPQPPAQNQQGFQSYFKNQSASAAGDSTSISLKTPNVVPGSAFNLGPTPPIGIYGENPGGYLDEFRGTPNHYYIPPGRGSSETSTDKTVNNSGTSATSSASPYHQFLQHPSRSPYPFMNHPPGIDPNSPLYQHLSLQRQEDLRAQVLLNQSILAAPPPGGYSHPNYNAALSMHKHYDAMNSMTRPWYP